MELRKILPILLLVNPTAIAVIVDRIAVIAGNGIVKDSDIRLDLRITSFLNKEPVAFTAASRKKSVSRLIDQLIIRSEVETGDYPGGSAAEAQALLDDIQKRYPTEAAFKKVLTSLGIDEAELKARLTWQLRVLRFIDARFRPAAFISGEEVEKYYAAHKQQLESSNRGKPATLDALRPQIEDILAGERVNQLLDNWLSQRRRETKTVYLRARTQMTRRAKFWIRLSLSLIVCLLVAAAIGIQTLKSAWFADYLRGKIISGTEEATGGKVEIGSFQFDWRHLAATIDRFILHGKESASDPALLTISRVEVRIKLLPRFSKLVDIPYLDIDQPAANIIVLPDGKTNIPEPNTTRKSSRNGLESIVELAIGRFRISNGSVAYADHNLGFSGRGERLRVGLNYRIPTASYQGDFQIGSLELVPGHGQPLNATVDLPVEIAKDRIDLTQASIVTRESRINVTGSLTHIHNPVIEAHVVGHVSLAEIQRAADVGMDPCKRDTPCFAEADVQARFDERSIQVSNANIEIGQTRFKATGTNSAVNFNGSLALGEVGRLFKLSQQPHGEIVLTGSANHLGTAKYELAGDIDGRGVGIDAALKGLGSIALSAHVTADRDTIGLNKLRVGVFGGELNGDASLTDLSQFRFNGRLRALELRDVERQISSSASGYDGSVSGDIHATGNLKAPAATRIRAQAQLGIAPGSHGVPLSGKVVASYDGARSTVTLGSSYLALPHSRLVLSGVLGERIIADFTSSGLSDLYPAVTMSMKDPPAAMPVALNGGKVVLHAAVNGSISSPKISAHVDADQFSVEQRPFDRLSADLSGSPSGVTIPNGILARQSLRVQFAGALGLRQWAPDNNSPVTLTLDMHNGDLADILALSGSAGISAHGSAEVSARINGTVGNPQGSARFTALNGSVDDQPFDKATGDVELSDQLVRLAAIDIGQGSANVHADGAYTHPRDTMVTGRVQLHAAATGLQLSQIVALQKQHPGLNGAVQLNADIGGDVIESSGQEQFAPSAVKGTLEVIGVRDNQRNFGDLSARADTSGSSVIFDLNSTVAGAAARITGRTTLTKDYPTSADVSIQNLRIENVLALAGESLPVKGIANITARVSGPIKDPTGSAEVNLTAANLYDEPISSMQASLRYSRSELDVTSLHVVTPAGAVTLNASFSHPYQQFETGAFRVHMESNAIRLTQIRNIQERKPGIGGTLNLAADVWGEVNGAKPVSVSKVTANINATDIAYNGRSYGNAKLAADTKGTEVGFTADSNFAGSSLNASGAVTLNADYPVTAKFTLANAKYSNVRAWFGDASLQPGFDALLEANGNVSGPARALDQMKGSLQVTRLELTTAPQGSKQAAIALKNDGVVSLDYDRGAIRVQNAHLTGKSADIAIGGRAFINGANSLNLSVKASTNLSLLQDLERDIHASGAIAIDTAIRGTFSEPLVNGTIQLKNASINIESLPNGLSHANGVIELNGSSATVRTLTAESGGGKLSLSGFATLNGSKVRYSLNANASHVRTRYQGISVVNNAALKLGGTSDKNLISGTVTVERVVYNAQSDIGSMLSQITGTAAPDVEGDTSGVLFNTRLAIHIRTAPDVRFETTLAQTLAAEADLTLGGTLQQPGMVGRVTITQGDLIFFGNEYTVDRGMINFYDPAAIDPRLSINLETTVESVTVTLGVTGPMNNLKLSYRSDPPLQFEEIVGLLTTGKRPSSDPNIVATQAAPPQQSVAEMGESALVSQAVASPLSSRLQRVFGVNQLRIDPTFASGSALPTARLSLQQRVANSVTFTYTQDLSQSNSELIRVEWAVNSRFSVVATRDENGIFGVDFFYKWQFR